MAGDTRKNDPDMMQGLPAPGTSGSAATAAPHTVVHCTVCRTCNGWGMLYDGKKRPR